MMMTAASGTADDILPAVVRVFVRCCKWPRSVRCAVTLRCAPITKRLLRRLNDATSAQKARTDPRRSAIRAISLPRRGAKAGSSTSVSRDRYRCGGVPRCAAAPRSTGGSQQSPLHGPRCCHRSEWRLWIEFEGEPRVRTDVVGGAQAIRTAGPLLGLLTLGEVGFTPDFG